MRTGPIRTVVWLAAMASCVAGIWLSRELTFEYLKTHGFAPVAAATENDGETSWFDAICSATESASCEEVAQSPYSVWPFGSKPGQFHVPVALLGMFYFTAVLAWLGLVGICSPSRWWAHLILVSGTAVGLGVSAFFEYVMWTRLKYYCPLCVITHVLSLLLFVFALALWPRESDEAAAAPPRASATPAVAWFAPSVTHWPTLRILVATPIVALVAIWGEYQWLSPTVAAERSVVEKEVSTTQPVDEKELLATLTTQPAEVLIQKVIDAHKKLTTAEAYQKHYQKQLDYYQTRWQHAYTAWEISPPVPISLEDRPFRGPVNAPHTLVVYSDFGCPGCKRFEDYTNTRLLPLSERYGGLIRMTFKYWPICTDCSPYASHNLHPAACKAALAAEAARIVGGDEAYWKMHDLLWDSQARWKGWKENRDFNVLAREIGLDEQAFEQAMAGDQAMARVKADLDEGANLGKNLPNIKPGDVDFIKVDSTPAIFVDNKRVWRPHATDALWLKIMTSRVPSSSIPVSGTSAAPTRQDERPSMAATRPQP
ncbi:MAG TPA: vitamin K epoxide reductase family protein [Phycisphaerae bacterium]|nr:vitamin K epoxide reductase family protein [Phycisphaerae bacterium]HRR87098.1 vitamin K epoxide reductase family protein [Phycisphaerae bacterium]